MSHFNISFKPPWDSGGHQTVCLSGNLLHQDWRLSSLLQRSSRESVFLFAEMLYCSRDSVHLGVTGPPSILEKTLIFIEANFGHLRNSFSLVILQLVLKIFMLLRFFVIVGESQQRDVWRQHCNGKNLVIIQTDPSKQDHLLPRLFRKVWVFFSNQVSGEGRCTDFHSNAHVHLSLGEFCFL